MSARKAPELVVDGFPKRGRRWVEIVTSSDHKDVGRLMIVAALGFLFDRGARARDHAAAAGGPREHLPHPGLLQPDALALRRDRALPLRDPARVRVLLLPDAAPDRRPRDRPATPRPARGLALPRRSDRPLRGAPVHPLRGRRQPAGAPQRTRLPRKQRNRCLGHRDRARDPRLRPDLDRPRRDPAQVPRPGDGLAAAADLLLGGGDRLLADAGDRPGVPGGGDDAADRSQLRRDLLRRRRRGLAAPLAAPELDLLHRLLHADSDHRRSPRSPKSSPPSPASRCSTAARRSGHWSRSPSSAPSPGPRTCSPPRSGSGGCTSRW